MCSLSICHLNILNPNVFINTAKNNAEIHRQGGLTVSDHAPVLIDLEL